MADMVSMTLRCFRIGSMVGIASIKGHNLSLEVCRSPRRQMQRGVGKIFAVKSSETANILQTLLCRAPSNKIINQPERSTIRRWTSVSLSTRLILTMKTCCYWCSLPIPLPIIMTTVSLRWTSAPSSRIATSGRAFVTN